MIDGHGGRDSNPPRSCGMVGSEMQVIQRESGTLKHTQEHPPTPRADAEVIRGWLDRLAPRHRLDLVGAVALPCPLPHERQWLDWVAAGFHGDLEYLTRDPAGRVDPTVRNPDARSVLVFGQRYTDGWPAGDLDPAAGGRPQEDLGWVPRVSRYARGRDYHEVLLGDIKGLLKDLQKEIPGLQAFPATDTGPYLEREYAWLAGLGFLGRNHCLIHEKLGSGIFLGVALTNLTIQGLPAAGTPAIAPLYSVRHRRLHPPLTAPVDLCGQCTRCLDACPTSALDPLRGLNAHRCLSTWTIEWQGQAPAGQEHLQGGLLFGCDICQSVCPWNQRAAGRKGELPDFPEEYAPLAEHSQVRLEDLAAITDEEFRRRFRHTPLWRCHPEGLRRNAQRVRDNLKGGAS